MKISKSEKEKINAAIKLAESKTSGEIATAIIPESNDYAVYELFFAVVVGFIYFGVMLFFLPSIETFLTSKFWNYNTGILVGFYGFTTFLVITVFYLVGNMPFTDRLLISKKIMAQKVYERALRNFVESGVYNTVHRTGILIFISVLEQRVVLLADSGINALIPQEKWDTIVAHIIQGIKSDKAVDHLIEAISNCGELLSENFPIQADDINELSDDIQILER